MTTRMLASTVLALLLACGDGGGGSDTKAEDTGAGTTAGDETGATMTGGGVSTTGSGSTGAQPTGSDSTGGAQPTGSDSTGGAQPTGGDPTGTGDDSGPGTDDSGPGTDDSGTTEETPARPGVLVYRGNDGTSTFGDFYRFDILTQRLSAVGRTVSDTEVWPASFDDVGLVILVVNAEPFDATQVADLAGVLAAGGVVLVSNEWSHYAESENLTALLGSLDSALGFVDDLVADAMGATVAIDGVTAHSLMQGVTSMVVAAGSAVTGCADGRALLEVDDVCLLAAEVHGPGLVLAFGDTNVLDDHVLMVAEDDQNFAFVANLIALLP